jgi:hypothetical protein
LELRPKYLDDIENVILRDPIPLTQQYTLLYQVKRMCGTPILNTAYIPSKRGA